MPHINERIDEFARTLSALDAEYPRTVRDLVSTSSAWAGGVVFYGLLENV